MKVKLLRDGESPDLGAYSKGDIRVIDDNAAALYIARGIAEVVKHEKATPVTVGKKEVNANGGE